MITKALSFSCVHATALSGCMTDTTYEEYINRNGVTAEQIGLAVIGAMERLDDQSDTAIEVIVRFSQST